LSIKEHTLYKVKLIANHIIMEADVALVLFSFIYKTIICWAF